MHEGEEVLLPPQSGAGAFSNGRRRRKVQRDVLGRVIQTEILNRDGTTYTTTVTDYNVRDQVTAVREYRGAPPSPPTSCPTATCQATTMSYDGYGRLQSHKLPQQNGPNTFAYNADDTIHQEKDARNATSTYAYNNNRGLVSSGTYAAPFPVPVPSPTTYTYDSVGNRKTQTDKAGSVAYAYDTLGRLTEERRTFNGLAGSHPLNYTYNLAGQLASLTDPAGQRIDYAYDKSGSLKEVTGTPYANVTQYASGMKYRAWGALHEADYGNGLKLSIAYDARLFLRRYHVRVPTAPAGTADRMLTDYEYAADGRVRRVLDRTDPGFDRSYLYDHVGRLMFASTANSAFNQSFGYDEFNHMTARGNGAWRHFDNTSSTYRNNRNTSTTVSPLVFPSCCPPQPVVWQYDAQGNVTRDHNKEYTYDAAGNKVRVFETTQASGVPKKLWIDQDYDADGEPVKRTEQTQFGSQPPSSANTYYLRSSVLDDKVVTTLGHNGAKAITHIYANGAALAMQDNNEVKWVHDDPVTGSRRVTGPDGALVGRGEVDPLGNEVPLTDPAPPDPEIIPDYQYVGNYQGSGNPYDSPSGCMVDGQPLPCSMILRFGTDVGRDGGSVHITAYLDTDSRSEPPTPFIIAVQVPGTQVDQTLDIDALRSLVQTFNTPDCQKFVKDLLTEAGRREDDAPVYTDLLDLFDAVRRQKNFSVGVFVDSKGAKITYSTVKGAVGAHNAQVLLSGVSNTYPTPELRAYYHASNAIAELTHVAGTKPSDYVNGAFSDYNLAKVAYDIARQHGKTYFSPPPTLDPYEDANGSFKYSSYYHDILKAFCVPKIEDVYKKPEKATGKPRGRRRRR